MIQFVAYDNLRFAMAKIAAKRGTRIKGLEFTVMGAIAKAVATVFTYPLQTAQSLLRNNRTPDKFTNTVNCLQYLAKTQGLSAWMKGIEAKLWQTVLTAAFQFLTYEKLNAFIIALFMRKAIAGKK